jgi:hypothetical protein
MIVDQKLNKKIEGVYLLDNDIYGTQIATSSKPNVFRKFFLKFFLGWKWISVKELKKLK